MATPAEHPVDAAIRAFARVMSAPPPERAARVDAFATAWARLRAHDPAEGVDTLALRLAKLGVPAGQALVDVSRVIGEVEAAARPGAKAKVARAKAPPATAAKAKAPPAKAAKAAKAKAAKAKAAKVKAAKAKATKAKAPAAKAKAPAAKATAKARARTRRPRG